MHQDYFDLIEENKIADSMKHKQNFQNNIMGTTVPKTSFVIELDDNKEMDILKSLIDPFLPPDIILLNTQFDLFNYRWQTINPSNVHLITKTCRFIFEEREETKINQAFNFIMQQAHIELVQHII